MQRSTPSDLDSAYHSLSRTPPARYGTDLVLCRGTRQIRVLSLPYNCPRKALIRRWEFSFGDCGLVVWPPTAALRLQRFRAMAN